MQKLVGAPHPTGAVTTVESSDGVPAAIAVLGADGAIERATTSFLERFSGDEALSASLNGELSRVLDGDSDHLTLTLDGGTAELSAVLACDGRRYAVLAVPSAGGGPAGEQEELLLGEQIDASPAIIWLKDLEGRYIRVNRRYEEQLGTAPEQVCGKTDADLGPGESIDGSRLRTNDLVPKEPLELEYTVAASDNRPAFTVLRFALRDASGKAIAVCGVAAPLPQAHLARSECERLMRIERWSRIDERTVIEELLDEWGLAPVRGEADELEALGDEPGGADVAEHEEPPQATATRNAELEQLQRETVEMLRGELAAVQEALERAHTEVTHTPTAEELAAERRIAQEAAAAAEQARVAAARIEGLLDAEREKVEALREELRAAQADLDRARAAAEAAGRQPTQEQLDAEGARAEQAEAEARSAIAELESVREELLAMRSMASELPTPDQLAELRERADQAETGGDRARREAATTAAELHAERELIASLQAQIQGAHQAAADRAAELTTLRAQLEHAQTETAAGPAQADLDSERERAEYAEKALEEQRRRAGEAEAALEEQRHRAEEAETALREQSEGAPALAASAAFTEAGPGWTASSQRALSAALAGVTEWRSALLQVVKIVGSEGGWDAAVAWAPDGGRGVMKCVAMWTADGSGLSSFETRTWQHRQDVAGTEFGRARNRAAPTCLLELQTAEDSMLRAAAAEGLSSAILVPLTDGGETLAMLELLSSRVAAPDADLMLSLESVALQLGAVARLLKSAAAPRWGLGRV